MDIIRAQERILIIGMIFLSITSIICLIRAMLGPRFTDRILGINVVNVKIIILISILAAYLKKGYLADIALVYATSRLFLIDYLNKQKRRKDGNNGTD